jgi:hypothetical protein
MSLLLPYAPPGVSLIAGGCVIGATPRGQPRTPALMLSHGCEGLRVRRMTMVWTFRRPCMDRSGRRPCMRNELRDLTTIVPAPAYHRRSCAERYAEVTPRDTVGIVTNMLKSCVSTDNLQPGRSESDPRASQLDEVVETLVTQEGYCPGCATERLKYVRRLQEMS